MNAAVETTQPVLLHEESGGVVTAIQIREMLGLSDRSAVRRLFGHLLSADSNALLDAIEVDLDARGFARPIISGEDMSPFLLLDRKSVV